MQAQGVHLSAGDTLTIGFDGVSSCIFTELAPPSAVSVSFATDLLGLGESLRLEMFENSLNELPFQTGTYNPTTSVSFVSLYGPSAWLDYQGLIRISMLSGSVDVNYAHFGIGPNPNTLCSITIFAVPEPTTCLLAELGAVISAVLWFYRRARHIRPLTTKMK